MKLNRLETHDRLQHFKKDQSLNVAKGAEDCLKRNPDSLLIQDKCPYIYLFAHPRTAEDGVTKIMYWQPRISRPTPQTNSYCFRAISKTDRIEVCWLLPPQETWGQYEKGKVTENQDVKWSIEMFKANFKILDDAHPEDLPEERQKAILRQVLTEIRQDSMMNKLY